MFVSDTLQELAIMIDVLNPISIDDSPVLFSLSKGRDCLRGKGFWKFNSSLTKDQNYIIEIKKLIHSFWTANKSLFNHQLKRKLLKYEVQRFTSNHTKHIAKEKSQQRINLENQLQILEKSVDENDNLCKYNSIKNELDAIHNHIREGRRIRSKCD